MGNFNFKGFRSAKSLKQQELADTLEMTQSNLSRFESKELDLSDKQFSMLYAAYGKDVVDEYRHEHTDSAPYAFDGDTSIAELVAVINRQNEVICQQIEIQNRQNELITTQNSRLLDLLEKIHFS